MQHKKLLVHQQCWQQCHRLKIQQNVLPSVGTLSNFTILEVDSHIYDMFKIYK